MPASFKIPPYQCPRSRCTQVYDAMAVVQKNIHDYSQRLSTARKGESGQYLGKVNDALRRIGEKPAPFTPYALGVAQGR